MIVTSPTRFWTRTLTTASGIALVAAMATIPAGAAHATTVYVVAQQNPSCSDSGAGTASAPFCTITAATKKSTAGDTVSVGSGTYHEQVTAPGGVTFQAASSSVEVVGADDLSSATWTAPVTGNAWTTQLGATALPAQVFAADSALTKAPAADQTTANSWFYVTTTRTLYVDLGGPAPAPSDALSAVRSYGFLVRNPVSSVTVQGFTVSATGVAGVQLEACTGCTVTNVTVQGSRTYGISDTNGTNDTITGADVSNNASIGIRLNGTTSSSVSSSTATANGYHGISVQGGSAAHVFGNLATDNLTPGVRKATGIDVSAGSLNAVVERNVAHDNDDSGIEIYTGSTGAVVRRNVSYDNGDHGVDISASPNATVVSNTAVGNLASGLNVEGSSTGTVLRDNIAVDNAVNTTRSKGNIRVEAGSTTGTTIDHDLVFQSDGTTALYEWNGVLYGSLAALRTATSQEQHGLAADPGFVGLGSRNLQLGPASPALDAADSSVPGWAGKDQAGASPVDQPDVADTGSGPVTYADLGAWERTTLPPDAPPVAALTVTPAQPLTGQDTVLDASGSTDDHGIVQYSFVCDAGQTATTGTSATKTCVYQAPGDHHPAVTVTDRAGHTDTASKTVTVDAAPVAPTAGVVADPASASQNEPVQVDAGSSQPGAWATITSYQFRCGDQPAMPAQQSPIASCTFATVGTKTVSVVVTNSFGMTDTASVDVPVVVGDPPTAALAADQSSVPQGAPVQIDAGDSTAGRFATITSYQFRCGDQPAMPAQQSGTATCTFTDVGTKTVSVVVTNSFGRTDTASVDIAVTAGDPPTAVVAADVTSVPQGAPVQLDASASTAGRFATITSYQFRCGNQTAMPAQKSPTATCAFRDTGSGTATVVVTNSLGRTDTAQVSVTVVAGEPPTARLHLSRRIIHVGRLLRLDASRSTGTEFSKVVSYRFKCGSHTRTKWQRSATRSCRFHRPGRMRIVLWVRSDLGLVDRAVRWVRVRR
ncbi:MAG TPA: PKD domain-containing protein [Nocardioides sp.]|uniref:PKD domain-containing protein n=1 Tax=Nocardioides sp. TaxID=35761 RepID=UPI002F42F96D